MQPQASEIGSRIAPGRLGLMLGTRTGLRKAAGRRLAEVRATGNEVAA